MFSMSLTTMQATLMKLLGAVAVWVYTALTRELVPLYLILSETGFYQVKVFEKGVGSAHAGHVICPNRVHYLGDLRYQDGTFCVHYVRWSMLSQYSEIFISS